MISSLIHKKKSKKIEKIQKIERDLLDLRAELNYWERLKALAMQQVISVNLPSDWE